MQIDILTSGQMRDAHQKSLFDEYMGRMKWPVTVQEFVVPVSKKHSVDQIKVLEREEYLKRLKDDCYLILLDENGKDMSSEALAGHIERLRDIEGRSKIQIAIGGAGGFHADILRKADLTLSFGRQTWPHMLVRIMLIEQIYRVQQILAGHPYHRS